MVVRALVKAVLALVMFASPAAAQSPVGALAVDKRQGDQWGWAVDHETVAAARAAALRECGAGCSVVLMFDRCGAYAADQDANSTAVGWAESYASPVGARQAALAECHSRGGGSGCTVRAWGCNGPVVEEGLNLDRGAQRQIQQGLQSAGFDPGVADGLFGPRTRAAIRNWQSSRGARATGHLDGPSAESLRSAGGSVPAVTAVAPAPSSATAVQPPSTARTAAEASAASAAQENLFWQSIMNSTNATDFEAYLEQFPNGVFRDCAECPEMVVLPGGRLALGRYEVTVAEYQAFASATSGGAPRCAAVRGGDSWRNPGFPQTDRHPVTCVSWYDTQAYVSWLSRTTGTTYRLPTEAEWEQGAAGSVDGCYSRREGACPVGASAVNAAGLFDMVGNLYEWTEDCWEDDCGRRVTRGGSWWQGREFLRPAERSWAEAGYRIADIGFRVSRALD